LPLICGIFANTALQHLLNMALLEVGALCMFQRFGFAQLLVVLVATVPMLGGCGSDDAPPPPAPAGANSALAGSYGNTPAPSDSNTPCTDKQVRECRVDLGRQGTVNNCFVGLQLCKGGAWGTCQTAAEIEAQLNSQ
jgi:hypothetical protein